MSENEFSKIEFFRSPFFHERHLSVLPSYQQQGLQRRIGFAPLHHALFLDATHALFHTDVSTFLINTQSNHMLWEIDCPAYDFACHWQRRILILVWEQRSFLLWDMNTGHLLHRFSYTNDDETATLFYNGIVLSPDGTLLAAAMGGQQGPFIAMWDLVQQQLVVTFPLPAPTYDLDLAALAFHPTGRFLACAHREHMYLWRLEDNVLPTYMELERVSDTNLFLYIQSRWTTPLWSLWSRWYLCVGYRTQAATALRTNVAATVI